MIKKLFITMGLLALVFSLSMFISYKFFDFGKIKTNEIEQIQTNDKQETKENVENKDNYYFGLYNEYNKLQIFQNLKDVDKIDTNPKEKAFIFYFDRYLENSKKIPVE